MPIVRRERATSQRSRGARANEHVAATKPRRGDPGRRNSETSLRIARARPGRRPERLETRWRGQADVAWDWNLTDLVGFGPVILKISPAGPGTGWARRRRLDPAQPHLRELAPPAKTGGKVLIFLEFESITKRDIKRDISATFVKNGMSRIVIFCHAQMSRIVTFFFLVRNGPKGRRD